MKLIKKYPGNYKSTTKGMYITIEQNFCTKENYWTLTIHKGNEKNYIYSEELFWGRYDRKKDCVEVAQYKIKELTEKI
tara:strand:+ start:759 stop:992 length:234 start_codon:yes stop_codon:yes gene_type:complete